MFCPSRPETHGNNRAKYKPDISIRQKILYCKVGRSHEFKPDLRKISSPKSTTLVEPSPDLSLARTLPELSSLGLA